MHSYGKIVTHHRPGLDEITGIFLLKRHAAEWGITNDIPVDFMADGDYDNPHMSQSPGVLYIGCGLGSWANEHYSTEEDKSACYLIARELQLCHRRYSDLVSAVTREDRYGAGQIKNHLAQATKDLYDMGWEFNRVYNWVKTALIALADFNSAPKQFSLDTDTCARSIEKKFGKPAAEKWYSIITKIRSWDKAEYVRACAYLDKNPHLLEEVETYKGKLKAFMPDDVQFSPRIGAAARSRGVQIILMQGALDYDQVGIVLQQKHTAGLSFSFVLEELRKHELMARGEASLKKVAQCAGEGTLEVCPIWHGHQAAQGQFETFAIYNRSKSKPLAPKTMMDWGYLKDVIIDALQTTPQGEVVKGANRLLAGGAPSLHRVFQTQ